jgi:RNA polymerase sigma-70 factor (ECF subfamily)
VLLVLETLAPAERAVFVLREVFDVAYDEIAEAVGKSPGRGPPDRAPARAHVAARRTRGVVSPAQARDALEAFWRAAETGDLQSPLDILTPDVVFLSPRPSGDPAGLRCSTWTPSPSRGHARPAGQGRRG